MSKSITESIEQLRKIANELEKEQSIESRKNYESQPHNLFCVGQWVTNGKEVGKVGWIENKCLNITKDMGYFGLDVKNGNLGFCGPCKRDEYRPLTGPELSYFTMEWPVRLTGEDIEEIIYHAQGELKNRIIRQIESFRKP